MIEVTFQVLHFDRKPIQKYICRELFIQENGKWADLYDVELDNKNFKMISFNLANVLSISQRIKEEKND